MLLYNFYASLALRQQVVALLDLLMLRTCHITYSILLKHLPRILYLSSIIISLHGSLLITTEAHRTYEAGCPHDITLWTLSGLGPLHASLAHTVIAAAQTRQTHLAVAIDRVSMGAGESELSTIGGSLSLN